MFWLFGCKACGILASWPQLEFASPALEGEVLTPASPGKSWRSVSQLHIWLSLGFLFQLSLFSFLSFCIKSSSFFSSPCLSSPPCLLLPALKVPGSLRSQSPTGLGQVSAEGETEVCAKCYHRGYKVSTPTSPSLTSGRESRGQQAWLHWGSLVVEGKVGQIASWRGCEDGQLAPVGEDNASYI